jgi:AcrR family transcriptional regulator
MNRRLRTSPRKLPTQARSRATVDAIVSAAARVLVKEGYESCSTNRVAREAGVSIGSLYQYFPSKESLVVAVMERHAAAVREAVEGRLAQLRGATLETLLAELVDAMIAVHQVEPRLHRVLLEQVPRIGALQRLNELEKRYEDLVADLADSYREMIEVKDVSNMGYVLVSAVDGLLRRALLERPELVATGKLQEHVARLVLGYVAPSVLAEAYREGRPLGRVARQ